MMKNGQAFGAESRQATILFVSAGESPQCDTIRKKMLGLQATIAGLEEHLDPAGDPKDQAKIRVAIRKAKDELVAESILANQLQCTPL